MVRGSECPYPEENAKALKVLSRILARVGRFEEALRYAVEASDRRFNHLQKVTSARADYSRKEALLATERELRASELRFQTLFESAPISVCIFDPFDEEKPMRIVDANPHFCTLDGFSREEAIGQDIRIIHPTYFEWNGFPSGYDPILHLQSYEDAPMRTGMVEHVRRDGTTLWVEYRSVVMSSGTRRYIVVRRHRPGPRD